MKALLLITRISLLYADASVQNRWQMLLNAGLNNHTTTRYRYEELYFSDGVTGYAVSLDGYIYKTNSAGRYWKTLFSAPGKVASRSVEFLDDKRTGIAGCLGNEHTAYRTTDGGGSWTNTSNFLPDTPNLIADRASAALPMMTTPFIWWGLVQRTMLRFPKARTRVSPEDYLSKDPHVLLDLSAINTRRGWEVAHGWDDQGASQLLLG